MPERIKTKVFDSAKEGSKHIAKSIIDLIEERNKTDEKTVLGLATGSSPIQLYQELIKQYKKRQVSFKNVVTFNLDEYYPMDPNAVQSFHRFMKEHLFDHVDILEENQNLPDGTISMDQIGEYCEAYEAKIDSLGGIDIQVLGIGRTGHIGFNEPGSGINSKTRLVTLDSKTRSDASRQFKGDDSVPRKAITMGVGTIFKAKKIFLLAWGEQKAKIVAKAVEGKMIPKVPATFLQQHSDTTFILDHPASQDLTRIRTPWLVGECEWSKELKIKAVSWLGLNLSKPVLKLTDEDYNAYGMGDLVAQSGSAYEVNLDVFRHLRDTITGWPGGKPGTQDQNRPERAKPFPKKSLIFSPHPDDDVISMGGTLIRLVDQGHDVHVAYQTSGNVAVHDDEVINKLSFMQEFSKVFNIHSTEIEDFSDKAKAFFQLKDASTNDIDSIRTLKGVIRRIEARAACRYCGVREKNVTFLDLPFYEKRKAQIAKFSKTDVQIVKDKISEIEPHQIFVAGDLADPHGTHRTCMNIIAEALHELSLENKKWLEDCWVWMYRGAWHEWSMHEIEMAVPLSPDELAKKKQAIFKHQSQKDAPVFPGDDPREFWQRAEDRNHETAKNYNLLGLPEYEAIEAFKKWNWREDF
jgi:glucosamine-6-phosphate deaminase